MQANDLPILDFIRNAVQLRLPLYQRWYDWTTDHCDRLLEDALRTGSDSAIDNHYVGTITTMLPPDAKRTASHPLTVIDGQQRLATLSLLLGAIAQNIPGADAPDGFTPEKIRARYLMDPQESDDRRYKLLLTDNDRDTLLGILHPEKSLPPDPSPRLMENYNHFMSRISGFSTPHVHALCIGINRFRIVHVALSPSEDNAQQIFESMNDTGLPLSPCDLIRNFLLMDQDEELQAEIYTRHLRPLEKEFGRRNFDEEFATFVRAFLALRTGQRPPQAETYRSFKEYAASTPVRQAPRIKLTEDLHNLGLYYCAVSRGTEQDPELRQAFQRLLKLRAEPALPLLLRLYQEWASGHLQKAEFARIVGTVESYLVRRTVCAIHPSPHIYTFTRLARASELGPESHFDYVNTQLLLQPETARFPSNEEFAHTLKTADLYSRPCVHHVLASLENHNTKEYLPLRDYSVEHVMPQQSPLPSEWRKTLGRNHQRIHDRWVHTLGNLTLTRYNSELGSRSFAKKKKAKGGYEDSRIRTLNVDLCEATAWTRKALKRRGRRLAGLALSVWPYPTVPAAMLEEARERARRTWTIDDHSQLQPGRPMRELYDLVCRAFAKLELDQPEPLRKYISFKAGGTNVVDIIPLHDRLRCHLNSKKEQLSDPHRMLVALLRSKHPGSGDVYAEINTSGQIPALVELVRQVLDRQQAQSGQRDSSANAS